MPNLRESCCVMNLQFVRVFGAATSARRYVWYVLAVVLALSILACGKECSLRAWSISLLSTLIAVILFSAFYFFVHLPGKAIIRTCFYLKRLRKRLDPLAIAIGAEVSVRHGERESLLTYAFPDGNYIVLTVWGDGLSVWSPNWNPGYEKHTEGFALLMRAIEKLPRSGHRG